MKKICFTFLILFFTSNLFSQKANNRDFTYYSKYNKRLVSYESVQRHIFSVGTGLTGFSTEALAPAIKITDSTREAQQTPLLKIGIGYHYFFLKNKKLNFFDKERYEHKGFSLYLNTYLTQFERGNYFESTDDNDTLTLQEDLIVRPQNELRITYSNPFLSYRGKMINLYFIHEYGLSIFNSSLSPIGNAGLEGPNRLYINIVPLSIKLGTKPIYFKTSFNFAARDNKLLQLQEININGGIDLQIYFYRTTKK